MVIAQIWDYTKKHLMNTEKLWALYMNNIFYFKILFILILCIWMFDVYVPDYARVCTHTYVAHRDQKCQIP